MAAKVKLKPTLLLVEGEPEVIALLDDLLSPHFHLRTATYSMKALSIVTTSKPDAIIANHDIRESRDLELIRQVRENPIQAHTPIIILSPKPVDIKTRVKYYQNLVDLFLPSPFDPDEVLSSILALLHIRKLIHQSPQKESFLAVGNVISEEDRCLLDRLDTTIRSHLDDSTLNMIKLASACFTTVRQLERKLPELINISPREYLRKVRMEHARSWLVTGHYTSVAQVSHAVGYRNARSFQRAFQAVFGQNPSESIRN